MSVVLIRAWILVAALTAVGGSGLAGSVAVAAAEERVDAVSDVLLKDVFEDAFLIGMAVEGFGDMTNPQVRHFNAVTPGNDLKWERVHPRPGVYNFRPGDTVYEFAKEHGMEMIGHTLIWHNQTPAWVFQDENGGPASRELLLERMEDHIKTVAGHYCGRVRGWDVVNEALDDDGSLRRSPWLEIIGESYLAKAFTWAHEACPSAELYYNDYNMYDPRKRAGAIRLIRSLQDRGVPIHGVGAQGHWDVTHPSAAQVEQMLRDFAELGLKVMITELDMSVFPWNERRDLYRGALPPELAERQARRYAEMFEVFLKYRDVIDRVTFWGLTDLTSWKNNFPVRGRWDHPLLFDRASEPKPAFWALVEVGEQER